MFTTPIHNINIHFVHFKSSRADARPLLLVHGWPGSFFEFHKVAFPLANPLNLSDPAFHVIIPSIPGYGFSASAAKQLEKLSVNAIGAIFVQLMGRLAYEKFFAQAGDWGSIITKIMAINYPKNCVAIHLNLAVAPLPSSIWYLPKKILFGIRPSFVLTSEEIDNLAATLHFQKYETAYFKIQGSKPFTLGVGLNDSPVGLLAWIAEKMCWGTVDKTDIITNVCIYWFTQSITSSFRIYKDNYTKSTNASYVPVPTAIALFKDISRPPAEWMQYVCNLHRFTKMPSGGHFAALEEPTLLIEDVRAFFGTKFIRDQIPEKNGRSKL
ncbi:hypothetical protein HK100_012871 [Physocladia obscura]|uniref:Epoxide hydrolase N-terminal domain-containing protein n=1 Tax=Physocladia obscura TaxID=109957 RepID=A0AAD5T9L3_9FUNG|nr:hypothetical protein HK100_012871 [Physocladia obscura]